MLRADDGELPVAPRLVPDKRASQAILRVAYAGYKPRHFRQEPAPALEVDRPHDYVARRLRVPEEVRGRGGKYNAVVQEYCMGRLSLLQGIFLTQELNQGLLNCRQILYQLSYQGSPTPGYIPKELKTTTHTKKQNAKLNVGTSLVAQW